MITFTVLPKFHNALTGLFLNLCNDCSTTLHLSLNGLKTMVLWEQVKHRLILLRVKFFRNNWLQVRMGLWKYRNKAGVKTQESYPATKRLKDYSTSFPHWGNRSRVVLQYFCSRIAFLCLHHCLVSLLYTCPFLLVVNFHGNFLPQVCLPFSCHLTANS